MLSLKKGEYVEIETMIDGHTKVTSIQLFDRNCGIEDFITSQLKEDELLVSYEVRPIYYKDARS